MLAPASALTLRRADRHDFERLYAIETAAFPEAAWPQDVFQQALEQPENHFQIALAGERPVGYILLNNRSAACPSVDSLAVDPSSRGQKVGEQLFLWSLEQARSAGAQEVKLEVQVGNTAAEKLYEKYGFVPTRLLSGYYNGKDGREMRLTDLQARGPELAEKRAALLEKLSSFPGSRYSLGG